jgi:hypothetical protein
MSGSRQKCATGAHPPGSWGGGAVAKTSRPVRAHVRCQAGTSSALTAAPYQEPGHRSSARQASGTMIGPR